MRIVLTIRNADTYEKSQFAMDADGIPRKGDLISLNGDNYRVIESKWWYSKERDKLHLNEVFIEKIV
jgi:hypothetical protein